MFMEKESNVFIRFLYVFSKLLMVLYLSIGLLKLLMREVYFYGHHLFMLLIIMISLQMMKKKRLKILNVFRN